MQVFAYLRLLRITQLPKILAASRVYAVLLMQRFPNSTRVIHNTQQIFSLTLFLGLFLHLTACVNIFQGTGVDSWIPLDSQGAPADQKFFDLYIDQLYFVTTTMTTIGYGEFNAAKYPTYESADHMGLVAFIMFFSIFTFTLIQNSLFSMHFDVKLNEVLKEQDAEA